MMNRAMMRAAKKNGRKMAKRGWNEFSDVTEEAIKRHIELNGRITSRFPDQVFQNNIYTVQVFNFKCEWGHVRKAMIRRNDELPEHNWLKIQRIKNEVFGEDVVALEVYPKQRNLVDVANLYWLWVLPSDFYCPIEVVKAPKQSVIQMPNQSNIQRSFR